MLSLITTQLHTTSFLALNGDHVAVTPSNGDWIPVVKRIAAIAAAILPFLVGLACFAHSFPLAGLAVTSGFGFLMFTLFKPLIQGNSYAISAPSPAFLSARFDVARGVLHQAKQIRDAEFPLVSVDDKLKIKDGKIGESCEMNQKIIGLLLLRIDSIYWGIEAAHLCGYDFTPQLVELRELMSLVRGHIDLKYNLHSIPVMNGRVMLASAENQNRLSERFSSLINAYDPPNKKIKTSDFSYYWITCILEDIESIKKL